MDFGLRISDCGFQQSPIRLFLPEIHLHRCACKVKFFTNPVFGESFVRIFNVLWQVAENYETGVGGFDLGDIFNLNFLAFNKRWRGSCKYRQQHIVQLTGRNAFFPVFVNGCGFFEGFVYTLLVQNRSKNCTPTDFRQMWNRDCQR